MPVLGYDDGASLELIDDNSGILVADKEMKTLIEGFEKFKNKQWERGLIQKTSLSQLRQ